MTGKLCAYFILFIRVLKMNPFCTMFEQNNVLMFIGTCIILIVE